MDEIKDKIKQIRLEKGLTQTEVAKRMNISYQSYAQYENGKRIPKLETKKRIAAALGVSLFELETFGEDLPNGAVIVWGEDGDATRLFTNENEKPFDDIDKYLASLGYEIHHETDMPDLTDEGFVDSSKVKNITVIIGQDFSIKINRNKYEQFRRDIEEYVKFKVEQLKKFDLW